MNDEFLLATLHKVFAITIEEHRPTVFEDSDDTVIGQSYRAYTTAKNLLEHTFLELDQYKVGKKDDNQDNIGL